MIKTYTKQLKEEETEKDPAKLKQIAEDKEIILFILELKDTKEAKKFVEDMLKNLERERKHAGNQQSSKD